MILEEKHHQIVKEIIQRNRKKKSCNKCYDRGFIGFTTEKSIIPCEKCVDTDAAMEEWKKYVAQDNELKEHYQEFFDEELPVEQVQTEETVTEVEIEIIPESTPAEIVKPAPTKPKQQRKTPTKSTTNVKAATNTPKTSPVRKTSARGK